MTHGTDQYGIAFCISGVRIWDKEDRNGGEQLLCLFSDACYSYVLSGINLQSRLVERQHVWELALRHSVGISSTCPGICFLALSLTPNGEFPSSRLPTHSPGSQQHCPSVVLFFWVVLWEPQPGVVTYLCGWMKCQVLSRCLKPKWTVMVQLHPLQLHNGQIAHKHTHPPRDLLPSISPKKHSCMSVNTGFSRHVVSIPAIRPQPSSSHGSLIFRLTALFAASTQSANCSFGPN